jgi:RimJ/RimL family protein N-acetyltransferase/glyoxylase-like metal-dependent hydrolase (beta-lactamase superfamily II)
VKPGPLHGQAVRLRRVTAGDAPRLTEILAHPEVARWWGRFDLDRARRELVDPDDGTVTFAVEADGQVIGLIQYLEEDEPDYRHAAIDIFLHPDWHGRGLGTDAIRTLARHLFEDRGHHRLTIDPAAHNQQAIRSYRRVGFRPVGVMRRYERGPDGRWHDGLLLDLLPEDLTEPGAIATDVPEAARGPAIDPTRGYLVQELGGGAWWVTDGDYQALLVTSADGTVVVDAPASLAPHLPAAVAEVAGAPVTHVVYSHSHYDHIGAAHLFGGATVIGHAEVATTLRRRADPRRPVPDVTFQDRLTVEVGDQQLVLEYRGPNHEPGNSFIHLPRLRILMLVDVVVPGWVPFTRLGVAGDVPGFLAAHDQALGYDFDTLVAGHLTRLGTREDVAVQRQYVLDVKAACERARTSVDPAEVIQTTGPEDRWRFAGTYFERLAQQAADEIVPRWVDRLGGVRAFTKDHCAAMLLALAHDWGVEGTEEARR